MNDRENRRHLKLLRPMPGGKTCHSLPLLRLDFTHNVSLRQPFNVLVNLFSGEAVQVKVGIHIVYIGNFRESDMVRSNHG